MLTEAGRLRYCQACLQHKVDLKHHRLSYSLWLVLAAVAATSAQSRSRTFSPLKQLGVNRLDAMFLACSVDAGACKRVS